MSHRLAVRRALISVYDKTGVVDLARALVDEFGVEILSTGGTARVLEQAGLPVTPVEQLTGWAAMLDGRVKTLHPRVHAAILADRDNPEHVRQLADQGIQPIDLVVVNLYPFSATIARPDCTYDEAIEMIDIGGPCLLRAAAKNHRHVLVVCDPADYPEVLAVLRGQCAADVQALLRQYALRAFLHTCGYDAEICRWLSGHVGATERPVPHLLSLTQEADLRYGENPHQRGAVFRRFPPRTVGLAVPAFDRTLPEGSAQTLSFNNLADASAALELCAELTRALGQPSESGGRPAVVCFIKHTNACGVAIAEDPLVAYRNAYLGDPNAAMGGVLAMNFEVDALFAAAVLDTLGRWGRSLKEAGHPNPPGAFFVEVWLAPAFTADAVRVIRGEYAPSAALPDPPKKDWGRRVRLLEVGDISRSPDPDEPDIRRIAGGLLMQTRDLVALDEERWRVVTRRAPTPAELRDLRLAWLICKHTKSNAVTICRDGMLLGNGAGQTSRVLSCRLATWLATENGHGDRLRGAVAASDAFFPFRDGPELLLEAGVTALIQPGGSKRDADTIAACDARGAAMIFTGTRHFRH
jgi:phosphoribosylaminoimidazolecarboxamide formyltransferase/IMP cyclohydrolase